MASQVEGVKWVPGTRFLVDGFRFPSAACRHYFLTHAHSDHTTGLSPTFSAGVIYCSHVTYRLLVHDMGMPPQVLRPLDLDVPTVIDGVEVTPICANHCPGAVCFLFKIPSTRSGEPGNTAQTVPQQTVLHTGDFRWCPQRHGEHPSLAAGVDTLMLDTTYCVPKWRFPPQDEVVSAMADLMRAEADGEGEAEGSAGGPAPPTTLFLCMSYHIGKERAYLGAAHRLGWHVWVPPAKRRVLRLLDLPPEWMALLEDDPERARIHVLGGGEQLHAQAVADRLAGTAWTRAVVLRPTGWSYRASGALDRREEGCVVTIGVPYSEHSSYPELQDCVRTLRPKRLIPTVNAGDAGKARAIVDRLCGLMDLSQDRSRLDAYLVRGSAAAGAAGEAGGGAGPSSRRQVASVDVALASVDVAEQQRLWKELEAARKGSKRAGAAAGTPAAGKRRGSILAYLTPSS